jgi:hypothetical protein
MKDRITIEGRDGAFGAYIARPNTLPASAGGSARQPADQRISPSTTAVTLMG